jgi:hypothetical protein
MLARTGWSPSPRIAIVMLAGLLLVGSHDLPAAASCDAGCETCVAACRADGAECQELGLVAKRLCRVLARRCRRDCRRREWPAVGEALAGTCGDGVVAPGEACDGGPCCNPACQPLPDAFPCDDQRGDDCTLPDTCDGAGTCVPNDMPAGTIAPTLCRDGNSCTDDQCNGSGGCQNPASAAGLFCDDLAGGDCTGPNQCDGSGTCLPNHALPGAIAPTQCADADPCTAD